jgi:hypothetical protein
MSSLDRDDRDLPGARATQTAGATSARMVYIDKWEEFMEAAQQVIAPAETDSGRRRQAPRIVPCMGQCVRFIGGGESCGRRRKPRMTIALACGCDTVGRAAAQLAPPRPWGVGPFEWQVHALLCVSNVCEERSVFDAGASGPPHSYNEGFRVRVCVQLFISDPENTRYLVKYRHVDAKLVLKVTDDKVCLKYRTDQSQDLKKMTGKISDWVLCRGARI